MRHLNYAVIPSGTLATSAINSLATGGQIPAAQMARLSCQLVIAGSTGLVGGLVLQVSNDKPPVLNQPNFIPTSWSTVSTLPVSGNGTFLLGFTEICAEWVRFQWLPTAGTGGTVKANAVMLGWGGQ